MLIGKSMLIQGNAEYIPLADGAVSMIFTSPPYTDARTYGIGAQRHCGEWIEWMLRVVKECCRVCRGLVFVNCAGVTRGRIYQPGPEGLMYEWWKRGGVCWRPAYWHRVGIPGSGGKHWLRADVEYILAFKANVDWPEWSDNTANGHPPKWGPGGEISHRLSSGARVNQWGGVGSAKGMGARKQDGSFRENGRPSHVEARPMYRRGQNGDRQNREFTKLHTKSLPDCTDEVQCYTPPVLANPGCLIQGIRVGGGLLGSKLAHENEAPFPEKLAEWFIKGWCKPGEIVLDPFSGSGTTATVARRLGRIGIGIDLRWSQCELGSRRLAEPERPVKRAKPSRAASEESTLFSEAPHAR